MEEEAAECGLVLIDEEDVEEVIAIDDGSPPEDVLLEEMGDLEVEEEGEEEEEEAEGAVVPERDDAVYCFSRHTGSVFSCSLHPSAALACSGGEDDHAYLWEIGNGTVRFECSGHKDSVTCTGFSHDGKYAATADMGGGVRVWRVEGGDLVCSFETSDIEWMQWHSGAHVLLAGTSDGVGWAWRVPSGECKTLQGPNCRNTCAALMPDGKRLCCGYSDGGVRVWDLKAGNAATSFTGSLGHESSITCVSGCHDNVLLLSGSEDGTARLVNTTSEKVLASFSAGFSTGGEEAASVEAVAFSPSHPHALTGSLTGVMGVWDIPTQTLRHHCTHEGGVVRLHCSRHSPVVFSGALDGSVRLWDIRSGQCVRQWLGHSDDILDLAVSRDDGTVLSASNDGTVRIFHNLDLPR